MAPHPDRRRDRARALSACAARFMTIGEGALTAWVRPRARQAQRFGAHGLAGAGLLCLLAVAVLVLVGMWPVPGLGPAVHAGRWWCRVG